MSLDNTQVVDVDVHLRIPNERLAERLDEPFATRLRETDPFLSRGWDRYLHDKIDRRPASTVSDIQERLCDQFGVNRPILNPTLKLPRVPEADLAGELMPAYNDVLLADFLDERDDFYGLASVSARNPEQAAEELHRIGDEEKIVGALIATTGVSPPLGDPAYDVIYKAAADNDLPIAFHAAAGGFIQDFPIQSRDLERFMAVHPLAHLWCQTLHLSSLLVNGTPEKFPDVDFLFIEAGGISWIPLMMFRFNKEYSIRRSEASLLQKPPEEYLRESFYFSTQPFDEPLNPAHLTDVLQIVGADRLMFSSDYPHWDFDELSSVDDHLRRSFSAADREQVLHGNATEVFGL